MKKINNYSLRICCSLLCLQAFTITSCEHHQKNETIKKKHTAIAKPAASNQEDQVVSLITNLDEVKRKTAEVKKDSKGKRSLVTYVDSPPTGKDPYYWVKVAEDNGGSLVAYYTFAVDGKTHRISYYDVITDSVISLEQWRKTVADNER
ncbi:hypothetical protein [Mucilaginibacter paludis]|uniref:Lipoprotein n=1 Tax=Mucilaginibacter paludis DSM 18603 TaxID=714943 RepID=H1Y6B0_9SPHI|nr:hypothetical protein [Mucilaginibacter paludis]EHQ24858.1 hypothetical protein Mucpa_0673 [Mucilaginibacter paludis DSM 18603]